MEGEAEAVETGRPRETKLTKDGGKIAEAGARSGEKFAFEMGREGGEETRKKKKRERGRD